MFVYCWTLKLHLGLAAENLRFLWFPLGAPGLSRFEELCEKHRIGFLRNRSFAFLNSHVSQKYSNANVYFHDLSADRILIDLNAVYGVYLPAIGLLWASNLIMSTAMMYADRILL